MRTKESEHPMDQQQSDILTVEEAADLLRIPRSSVYKLAQEGKIPAQKVGRHWRFHRATLVQWVARPISARPDDKQTTPESLDFS